MNPSFNDYLSGFKWIRGISTAIGVSVPALSFFTLYAPPLFAGSSILTAAIAAAVIALTYYYTPRLTPPETEAQKLVNLALAVLACAVILLVVYIVMVKVCTVADPPEKAETRYQIGFWNFDWSLTEDGKFLKHTHNNATPWELMNYGAVFTPDGPAVIWKFWSIMVTGICMIVVFLFAFVLWVFGWSLLAKRRALGP
jgi:hypothetical protein